MQIYWIENKQKHGPIAVPDIIARIQMGEIDPEATLGWHSGCEKWIPLKELPALADFLSDLRNKSKQTQEQQETPDDEIDKLLTPSEPEKSTPSQIPVPVAVLTPPTFGMRMLARLTDYAIYAAIFMSICYLLKIPYNQHIFLSEPLFWLPSILIESLLLAQFGTTPGKKLMGITVRSLLDGNKPSMGCAFSRSLGVFIMGMGCFFPIISIIMMIIAYNMINKGGLSLWDSRARTIALNIPDKKPAKLLCVFILFISYQIVSICIMPWIPELIQQIEPVFPELAEQLKQLYSASL